MFGIFPKRYYFTAGILGIPGIVFLIVAACGICSDNQLCALIGVFFLSAGFVLAIRPKFKRLRIEIELCDQFRISFYDELTTFFKKEGTFRNPEMYENEDGCLSFCNFVFSGLNFSEGKVIMRHLLKDYLMIVSGIVDKATHRFTGSDIENLDVIITGKDGSVTTIKVIENHRFVSERKKKKKQLI